MIVYFVLILIMTLIGSVASLFLKKASSAEGIIGYVKNANFYIGAILYLVSAVLNIYALRYFDYSIVLPLTSITYIWTMVLSYYILKEKITTKKIFGVIFVIGGAVILSI